MCSDVAALRKDWFIFEILGNAHKEMPVFSAEDASFKDTQLKVESLGFGSRFLENNAAKYCMEPPRKEDLFGVLFLECQKDTVM